MSSDKPLWKRRLSVVEVIYSHLIFSLINKEKSHSFEREEWTNFELDIFKNYLENREKYTIKLAGFLRSDWTLDRLNKVILCILYEAISEYQVHKTPVGVLIEQSVKTVKNYCEPDEYKFVHALLENCLKSIDRDGKAST